MVSPALALAIVLGVAALAAAAGLVWRARQGRVGAASGHDVVRPADVGTDRPFGSEATLLQFSTEFCSTCPQTRRLLGALADERPGVEHIDIDLTSAPDLASRFAVLQTPTTLVLDSAGVIRARIGGPPRRDELVLTLDGFLGSRHDPA
jgi:thiol-disulfide isomerase/thioredoxin